MVEAKWDGLREAFHDFDTDAVASMTPEDVDRLVGDERVIRNRRKIEATIHNARALMDLEEQHGIVAWLRGHEDHAARARAIRQTFKYLGPASIPELLWTVGVEEVAECHG